jgi:cation transport ATPase
MTCASCAARIEKKLNRMPGVSATVNYATESAHVALPEGTPVEAAMATVEATGYTAHVPQPPQAPADLTDARTNSDAVQDAEVRSLGQRLMISAVLTAPVLAMAMIRIVANTIIADQRGTYRRLTGRVAPLHADSGQKGLSNWMIPSIILHQPRYDVLKTQVIAASAEPKSIAEIQRYGVNIIGASRGRDTVCCPASRPSRPSRTT